MAVSKQIRINVDDSELNKLRQQAEGLARDMIRASREFATGGDEVIADLEEQIRLMERQARIAEEYSRSEIERQRRAGQITPQQAQQQIQQVGAEAQNNRILIDLVRELIETTKQTSKDEIRADREDVERRIRSSQTVGQLGPAGDPFQNLMETLQQQYLGLDQDDPAEPGTTGAGRGKGKNKRDKLKRRVQRVLNAAASAENEYALLASGLEGIPVLGKAGSILANRSIAAAEDYQRAAIGFGRQRLHSGLRDMSPLERGRLEGQWYSFAPAELGYTNAEALNALTGFEGLLQRDIYETDFTKLLGGQKALGLDANTMTQLLSTARYDRSINDPSRILAQFDKFTRETGRSLAMIPELVGTFTSAANQILTTRGEVDTASLSRVISNMSRRTGFEGVRLDRLTGAYGNLGRTSNPVTRALLMRAFRETDPNASYVDILERMEGGLDEGSRPGLQRFFEIMRERTGGGDALVLALRTALPDLSIKDIRDVIRSGGFAKALQRDQIAEDPKFLERGKEITGPIEKSSKYFASTLEELGDGMVQFIESIKETTLEAYEVIKGGVLPEKKTEADEANTAATNDVNGNSTP